MVVPQSFSSRSSWRRGSTAAGLRAGKPTVICPFLGDQPFWGRLVEQSRLGPKRIPQSRLSVDRLADAIRLATSDLEIQKKAEQLGNKIRSENGAARAVEIIKAMIPG